jgi:hypothetical protein
MAVRQAKGTTNAALVLALIGSFAVSQRTL